MEKEKIITKFLEKGNLLTPGALDRIASKNEEEIFSKIFNKTILDERDFEDRTFRIIKTLSLKPTVITTDDFLKFYTSKYNKMKKIITDRLQKDFISLNKMDSYRNEVHVIGIIKDISEKSGKKVVEIEDMTTSISVIFENLEEEIELDDVIAVSGISAGKILYGKKILFPDIPLRQPVKGIGKACFVSDLHLNESPQDEIDKFFSWIEKTDIQHIFIAGDIGDSKMLDSLYNKFLTGKKVYTIPGNVDGDEYPQLPIQYSNGNIISLSNPAMVELNGLKILIVHDFDISFLKKRYLGKTRLVMPEDFLVLEDVPDIVHFGHTHQPQITNYKSVTMVNSGSLLEKFSPVVIDFSTRDVEHHKIL